MQDWLNKYPFSGIWNDMNEPANFERDNYIVANSYNHEGKKFESIYNLYGFQMAKASYEAMIQIRPDETPFSITRSGYPGVQKYCVIWHGDNHAWWEHLRLAINTCINYSLSGVYYTGADVPGFFQNAPDDLAVRFFQLGAFMPLFRGHSAIFAKYNEPYRFSESAFQAIKKAIYLRYSLAREWISNLDYCYSNAISPIMPVFRKSGALVQDQFLLFDKFLVAPITTRGQEESLVYLPEGTWYRLGHPDSPIEGNKTITCEVDLTTIPVFVRAGSIVFVNVVGKNVEETLSKGEVRELYLDSQGEAKGIWSSASFEKNEISAKEVYFRNGQFI
jgi:alpha-glucosidase